MLNCVTRKHWFRNINVRLSQWYLMCQNTLWTPCALKYGRTNEFNNFAELRIEEIFNISTVKRGSEITENLNLKNPLTSSQYNSTFSRRKKSYIDTLLHWQFTDQLWWLLFNHLKLNTCRGWKHMYIFKKKWRIDVGRLFPMIPTIFRTIHFHCNSLYVLVVRNFYKNWFSLLLCYVIIISEVITVTENKSCM